MTIKEIEIKLNNGEISADDQVWWNMESGDMIVATDEEMANEWDWSHAGTVAEMIAAQ